LIGRIAKEIAHILSVDFSVSLDILLKRSIFVDEDGRDLIVTA
jgi:hypothetical protein